MGPGAREATRSSFVERLRNWCDDLAWHQFLGRYGPLIRHVARRAGLSVEEADDVVQETAASVARKMPGFEYDRSRCSLEGWVRHVTHLRIKDQLRRRFPVGPTMEVAPPVTGSGTSPGAWVEQVADERGHAEQDEAWQEAWRQALMDRALERVQMRVAPDHYQLFCLSVVDGMPGRDVARTLGVSLAKVYVVRHRVLRLLRAEVARLRSTPGGLG